MGHYEVAVITAEKPTKTMVDEIMAPFSSDYKIEPFIDAPYDVVKAELYTQLNELEEYRQKELTEALENDDIGTIRYYNKILNFYDDVDKDGNAVSTFNQNAKWDYYQIRDEDKLAYNQKNFYIQVKDVARVIWNDDEEDTEEELMKKFPNLVVKWNWYLRYSLREFDNFRDYLYVWLPGIVVMPDSSWIERENYLSETNKSWNEQYNAILDSVPGEYYMTCLNIHM